MNMPITLRKDPRTVFPDLIDWFEEPFLGLRPYLQQPIRIEDYVEDGHYVVRAEVAGVDPAKDLDVSVGAGYLSIRAERSSHVEGKHRSEFRYGTFSRSLQLPADANPDDVTADYAGGILTVKVALKDEKADALRKVEITAAES
jgi:HSP20 family molecular chaperone IbpA